MTDLFLRWEKNLAELDAGIIRHTVRIVDLNNAGKELLYGFFEMTEFKVMIEEENKDPDGFARMDGESLDAAQLYELIHKYCKNLGEGWVTAIFHLDPVELKRPLTDGDLAKALMQLPNYFEEDGITSRVLAVNLHDRDPKPYMAAGFDRFPDDWYVCNPGFSVVRPDDISGAP